MFEVSTFESDAIFQNRVPLRKTSGLVQQREQFLFRPGFLENQRCAVITIGEADAARRVFPEFPAEIVVCLHRRIGFSLEQPFRLCYLFCGIAVGIKRGAPEEMPELPFRAH